VSSTAAKASAKVKGSKKRGRGRAKHQKQEEVEEVDYGEDDVRMLDGEGVWGVLDRDESLDWDGLGEPAPKVDTEEPNELHITLIAARRLLVMDKNIFSKGGSSGELSLRELGNTIAHSESDQFQGGGSELVVVLNTA
jgi:hypothetical protein